MLIFVLEKFMIIFSIGVMMSKNAILIPSFNRVDLCNKCINSIRKNNRKVRIFITVELDQYKMYMKGIENKKRVTLIKLEKFRWGGSYSFSYGLEYLDELGFKYVLRADDDTLINYNVKKAFKLIRKYGDKIPWIGGWFSIYDLFYGKPEIRKYVSNKSRLVHAVSTCCSRSYVLNLKIVKKLGNWDWRYRALDDADMEMRMVLAGYKVVVCDEMKCGSTMARMKGGGMADDILSKAKKVLEHNAKIFIDKFGEGSLRYGINKNGKPRASVNWKMYRE